MPKGEKVKCQQNDVASLGFKAQRRRTQTQLAAEGSWGEARRSHQKTGEAEDV